VFVFMTLAVVFGADVPAPKPINQWTDADWKAYGKSVAGSPEAQKMSPLDRAVYVADRVGAKLDEGGIVPNTTIGGRIRSGFGNGDLSTGSCGDLTVKLRAAYDGAGIQNGQASVELTGYSKYNPLEVNRDHGTAFVVINGKQYVTDLWLHGGDTKGWFDGGHFSGFKNNGGTMTLDEWKKLMNEMGYNGKDATVEHPDPPRPDPASSPRPDRADLRPPSRDATPRPSDLRPTDLRPPSGGTGPCRGACRP
jgi:hypothetical protein